MAIIIFACLISDSIQVKSLVKKITSWARSSQQDNRVNNQTIPNTGQNPGKQNISTLDAL